MPILQQTRCFACVLNVVPEKVSGTVKQRDLQQEEQVQSITELFCFVSRTTSIPHTTHVSQPTRKIWVNTELEQAEAN